MDSRIRLAQPGDAAAVERIENAADELLIDRLQSGEWPSAPAGESRLRDPGFLLVLELDDEGVMGFAHVLEVDGLCHLEQLSVRPEHARQGLGRALVDAAKEHAGERGHTRITLRTYADVPWNAPFYRSAGFVEDEPATDFHIALIDTESRLGLDRHGRRVQMSADLRPSDP